MINCSVEASASRSDFCEEHLTQWWESSVRFSEFIKGIESARHESVDSGEWVGSSPEALAITELLRDATVDERAIALRFVRKIMGEGRREHGRMDLRNRSTSDLLGEMVDESIDGAAYALMAERKMEQEGCM